METKLSFKELSVDMEQLSNNVSMLNDGTINELTRSQLLSTAYKLVESVYAHSYAHSQAEVDNLEGSGIRAAQAIQQMLSPDMEANIKHILKKNFPVTTSALVSTDSPMILFTPEIRANSLCPHHFLPVQYTVFIAIKILDGGQSYVYGLSKYTRLAQELAKRPVIQEQYTRDIVDILTQGVLAGVIKLETATVSGAMAIVSGVHGCMSCRGVNSDSPSITSYSYHLNQQDTREVWSMYNGRSRA